LNPIIGNNNIEYNDQLWIKFKEYLVKQHQSPHTVRNKVQYVKRFYYVLEKENAQDLLSVSIETRQHAMKSLASLSKYLGIYDKWQDLIKRYQLKWPKKGGFDVFHSIFDNNEESYSSMLKWIKTSVAALPKECGNIILFTTLTGLRPDESYKAIELIKANSSQYVDRERMLILHYKFPEKFLRVSKKAYISVISDKILKIANQTESFSKYDEIRNRFRDYFVSMNMYYCRKVFATYLRTNGIEPEIIDLLQGRTPSSIFVNHYYRPDMNQIITARIRPVLNSLFHELI
jgi:intergrase/recombinase